MRGRSRYVRRSVGAEPHEVVADRLARSGQHERSASDDGPEKDLEPSIPADVGERAPDDIVALRERGTDRRCQAAGAVDEHIRPARPATGDQDPPPLNLET